MITNTALVARLLLRDFEWLSARCFVVARVLLLDC